jgi:hypothetical protein
MFRSSSLLVAGTVAEEVPTRLVVVVRAAIARRGTAKRRVVVVPQSHRLR